MGRFLDCLCDDNLKSLIIDGNPTAEELETAWMHILSEYMELQSDDETEESDSVWSLSREIMALEDHLFIVDVCIAVLCERYSGVMAENLRKLGYSFRPVETDPDEYMAQLQSVVNKAKSKKLRISQLTKELKEKLKETGPKKPDRSGFEDRLLHYEEMQKVSYDIDTITVYKYLALEKKFDKKQIQLQNEITKRNGGTN